MDPKTIGKRLHDRRTALGLSLTAFAEKVEVSKATASDWERGKFSPTLARFPKIARVLKCEIVELLGAD